MLVRREVPHTSLLPALRNLMTWDPFREIAPFFGMENEAEARFLPHFEIKESTQAYVFKADVPGVEEKDIDIALMANRLTVGGKRVQERLEQGETYYTSERSYGTFTRTFTLPEGIDAEHVEAELKGGVLTIIVPKLPELQPRKVTVKGVIEKVKGALEKGAKA
jgi:HSP20 family protein